MKMVKRWGVMTLAASLVLGSMGAALADEGPTETETAEVEMTKEPFDPEQYLAEYEWPAELVAMVYSWFGDGACEAPAPTGFGLFSSVEADECTPPSLTGPNGQLNHGSMVSSVVHFLKTEAAQEILGEFSDMPRGQLVRQFAHLDFGKGFNGDDPDGEVEFEEADEADGHGPPEFVLEKKAAKDAAKQLAKAAKAAKKNDRKDTQDE